MVRLLGCKLSVSALLVIWNKLQTLRKFYEGDPGNEKTPEKPGRLRVEREAAQTREDEIRSSYDKRLTDQRKHYELQLGGLRSSHAAELKGERDENKELQREINETLKKFLGDPE